MYCLYLTESLYYSSRRELRILSRFTDAEPPEKYISFSRPSKAVVKQIPLQIYCFHLFQMIEKFAELLILSVRFFQIIKTYVFAAYSCVVISPKRKVYTVIMVAAAYHAVFVFPAIFKRQSCFDIPSSVLLIRTRPPISDLNPSSESGHIRYSIHIFLLALSRFAYLAFISSNIVSQSSPSATRRKYCNVVSVSSIPSTVNVPVTQDSAF